MRNTFGHLFTLTTFGESHGVAVGGVIDGFPAGIDIDMEFVQNELNRRRPGQSHITTSRNEADKSGVSQWCVRRQEYGNTYRFRSTQHQPALARL